jgi:universal stress protein A
VKILIAVDDSLLSKAAVDFVRRWEWPEDVEIVVLSVAHPAPIAYALSDMQALAISPEVGTDEVERYARIARACELELQKLGCTARSRVASGEPREAILDVADQERVDLIVVGSHGRAGVRKLVMGSVANQVVTHAHCDVLVVKTPSANRPAGRS